MDLTPTPRPTLLVADDDPVLRLMITAAVEDHYDVVGTAADAAEAALLAERHQPDVALVDVQMPGGGGLRATQEIAVRAPATAVVILSADDEHSAVLELLAAGAVSYLRKGGSSQELMDRLRVSKDAHARLVTARG